MKTHYLIPRKFGDLIHFDFRYNVPKDLVAYFDGRTRFQISLKDVSTRETLLVSITLKNLLQELFQDIRLGMKELSLDDIKEILRTEVRKSILQHIPFYRNNYNVLIHENYFLSILLHTLIY